MLRSACSFCIVLAMLASAAPIRADWDSFWHGVDRDWHRNNAWPHPFTHYDVRAVHAPFGLMIAKGWQRQNLLGDHHFDEGSTGLTKAGQLKVRWILTQSPIEFRTVFIEKASSPEVTVSRVEVVRQAALDMIPEGDRAEVVVSDMATQGWPADSVDAIGRKYVETAPSPRLPQMQEASDSK